MVKSINHRTILHQKIQNTTTFSIEEKRQLLDSLFFENAPVAGFILDVTGCIQRVNPIATTLLALERDQLKDQHLIDFVDEEDRPLMQSALKSLFKSGQPQSFVVNMHNAGGFTFTARVDTSVTANTGYITITPTENIQKLREEIDRLKASNSQLDAFTYSVAHDLKNVAASIIGTSSLMQSYFNRMSHDEILENIGHILDEGYQLKATLDSLFLLAHISNVDEIETEPINMRRVIDTCLEELDSRISEAGAQIEVPATFPNALGYAPWIERVWTNYISNALKYGGDPPEIEIGADRPRGDSVRFWIRDNGTGISRKDKEVVFGLFERTSAGKKKNDGHGLGLTIVKRIIEKLGGEVGVESIPGEGSTFSFTLPRP